MPVVTSKGMDCVDSLVGKIYILSIYISLNFALSLVKTYSTTRVNVTYPVIKAISYQQTKPMHSALGDY